MRSLQLSICFLFCLSLCAAASGLPDFSGDWVGGPLQPEGTAEKTAVLELIPMNLAVKQTDEELRVESVWGNKPSTKASYLLDGAEHFVAEGNGNSIAYRAKFDGSGLRIDWVRTVKTPFGDVDRAAKEEWALSDDNSTLTIARVITDTPAETEAGVQKRSQTAITQSYKRGLSQRTRIIKTPFGDIIRPEN